MLDKEIQEQKFYSKQIHHFLIPKNFWKISFQFPESKSRSLPGLKIKFKDEVNKTKEEWCFVDGLGKYLSTSLGEGEYLPEEPIEGEFEDEENSLAWAVAWELRDQDSITESYVNLIPTIQGGTHVAGMRTGITDALKNFVNIEI